MPSPKIQFLSYVLLLPFCVALYAQDVRDRNLTKNPFDKKQEKRTELSKIDLAGQALETAIDPETYIVGPGDVFNIEVEGLEAYSANLTVSPEGKLILPTLGAYDVEGKSVAEVRRIVAEQSRTKYIGGQIKVNLVAVRSIRVHVTGQVAEPGTYQAKAVFRISDLITLAGGLNPWANARAIELRRQGQSTQMIDYFSFLAEGRIEENVAVRGGDIIYVPSVYSSNATVQVEGRVQSPGLFAIHHDENAEEFLFRINALQQNSDLSNAVIIRKSDLTDEDEELPLFKQTPGNGKSLTLKPDDILRIPAIRDSVYVQGDCLNPGSYPYQAGWRARDYAGLAGPKDTAVSPKGIKVVRANRNQTIKGADVIVERGDTIIIPSNTRKKLGDVFGIVAQLASITYFVVIIREQILNK
jgi:protein involved in polysaccharide export with SLBB domain